MEMSGFLQGTHLGKYELLECIGQGGMADVYRAKQLSAFEREVALKVMRADFTGDAPFRKRFLREAHAISRLSHPNILPLIEFGEENGTLYLVMPLVREGTLRDLLRQHAGPLSLEEALPLFVPLCDAVQYAHQEGIIHRDIKPQNILLQRRWHVWLADFGIARDRLDTRMTTTGVAIGSVEYMAPEQAEGRANAQSDIYSLGVVLYQLLTGVVPYAGTMPLEVLFRKASTPLPDPRLVNPRLPAELVEILQVALAPDPGERFATAEALGKALQQVSPTASPAPLFPPAANWPPIPPAPAPLVSDDATTRRVDRRPLPGQQNWGPAATTRAEDATIHEDHWHHPGENVPREENHSANRSRPKYLLLVAALAFLALGITSIAYGYLGQNWLRPSAATTGAQQLTPLPGTPTQPTSGPGPVAPGGPPPFPPASPAPTQPGQPPTTQPTAPATPQPTPMQTPTAPATPPPTETPQPTPTTQPTAPATPQPTQTTPPAPPTAPATPQPTQTTLTQPTAPASSPPPQTPTTQPPAPPAQPTASAQPNPTQGPGAPPGNALTPDAQP